VRLRLILLRNQRYQTTWRNVNAKFSFRSVPGWVPGILLFNHIDQLSAPEPTQAPSRIRVLAACQYRLQWSNKTKRTETA